MGKIKKTDDAAKTAEAWWALLVPDGSLGRSIYRAIFPMMGIGVSAGAVVAATTDWISSFGVAGWAATMATGGLTTIWGMAGWAHWRSHNGRTSSDLINEKAVEAVVSARLEEFLATRLRAEFSNHSQMHAHDEKFIELAKQATDARTVANGAIKALDASRRQWDAWIHQHVQSNDHRFRSVDGGFRALRDRESLLRLSEALTTTAGWLLRSSDGEKVDDWGLWNHRHFEWRRAMTEYSHIASRYISDVAQSINEVPTHTIMGEWVEDQSLFPTNDAMIEHRTTAVTMRNFREHHPRVISCVESFAFQSPSMKLIPET